MNVKELKELLQNLDPADDDKFVCFCVRGSSDEIDPDYYRLEGGSEIGHGTFEIFLEASYIPGV